MVEEDEDFNGVPREETGGLPPCYPFHHQQLCWKGLLHAKLKPIYIFFCKFNPTSKIYPGERERDRENGTETGRNM